MEMQEYELAYRLGMSVHQIREHMSYDEYIGWFDYFYRRPAGWEDDNRAYMIMARSGMSQLKQKPEDLFPSLRAVKRDGRTDEEIEHSQFLASLKASPFARMFPDQQRGYYDSDSKA